MHMKLIALTFCIRAKVDCCRNERNEHFSFAETETIFASAWELVPSMDIFGRWVLWLSANSAPWGLCLADATEY